MELKITKVPFLHVIVGAALAAKFKYIAAKAAPTVVLDKLVRSGCCAVESVRNGALHFRIALCFIRATSLTFVATYCANPSISLTKRARLSTPSLA